MGSYALRQIPYAMREPRAGDYALFTECKHVDGAGRKYPFRQEMAPLCLHLALLPARRRGADETATVLPLHPAL